jgi:hypothetical protein
VPPGERRGTAGIAPGDRADPDARNGPRRPDQSGRRDARAPRMPIATSATPSTLGDLPRFLDIPCHDQHGRGPLAERSRAMKKAIGWILLILVIFYIGTNPGPAADIAQGIGSGIANIFRNIGVFFSNLAT